MAADAPWIFIEGIDVVIRRDLAKFKAELSQSRTTIGEFRNALAQLIARKKHYWRLRGTERYDDEALEKAVNGMAVDIRAMQDKVYLAQQREEHCSEIVDKLTEQLRVYEQQKARKDAVDC